MRNKESTAINPIQYPGLDKMKIKLLHASHSWWKRTFVLLLLLAIFSALDGVTLYSVIDNIMTERWVITSILTVGLAVILNFIPLVLARILHAYQAYNKKIKLWMFVTLLLSFVILFAFTFNLRWQTRDFGFSSGSLLTDSFSDRIVNSSSSTKDSVQIAVVLLLGTLPLITSIVNFFLAYITDNPIEKRRICLELQKIQLEEILSDLNATVTEMDTDRLNTLLSYEKNQYIAAQNTVHATSDSVKAKARLHLSQFLKNPESTLFLTENDFIKANLKGGVSYD